MPAVMESPARAGCITVAWTSAWAMVSPSQSGVSDRVSRVPQEFVGVCDPQICHVTESQARSQGVVILRSSQTDWWVGFRTAHTHAHLTV